MIQDLDQSETTFIESSIEANMPNIKLGIPNQRVPTDSIAHQKKHTSMNYATFSTIKSGGKSPLLKKFTQETINHFNLKDSDLPQAHRSGRPIKDHIHLNKKELAEYKMIKEMNYYSKLVNNSKHMQNALENNEHI